MSNKSKSEGIFLQRFFHCRFLEKVFSKICRLKSTFKCRYSQACIKLAKPNVIGVRSWIVIVMINCICILRCSVRGRLFWNLARHQKARRGWFLPWRSCRNCLTSFCIALSASQVYRAQTLRQKHDPLWGYQRQPYSRQKDGVCRLVLRGSF